MLAQLFPIIFIHFIAPCDGAKILAIMPTPSYSHQVVFTPLWYALNAKGHEITLLTTNPLQIQNLKNFRQIDWSFTYYLWNHKHNSSNIIRNFNKNLLLCLYQFLEMMKDIITQELKHPEVQEILKSDEKFDLVITEALYPVMAAFSVKYNCPWIGISPMDATMFLHEGLNSPVSPALYPDFIAPFDSKMSFLERVINTFLYFGGKIYFKYFLYADMDKIIGKYFGGDVPPLEVLQKEASMVFLNINPVLHNVRPLAENVKMVGGGLHFTNKSSLPSDIQTFLDSSSNGAIYFSLGTNVLSDNLSEEIKTMLVATFKELPYKVIWKFEDVNFDSSKHPNIFMRRWLPQQEILKHHNVKLFITQGGLQSVEEAILSEIPVITMPYFVDQYSNVRKIVRHGIGLNFDLERGNKHALKTIINEVITNPKYKQSVKKLAVFLKDQPISGIENMVWWVEYILKHKGARFIKNNPIPLYQYLLLDVFALVALILIIFIFLVKITWRKMHHRSRKTIKLE